MKNIFKIIISLFFFLLLVYFLFVLYDVSVLFQDMQYRQKLNKEEHKSKKLSPFPEGEIIITALERYKEENGKYPLLLSDLIPEYLKKIPHPNWGINEWQYRITEGNSNYYLIVKMSSEDNCFHEYSSNYKQWIFSHS